MLLRRHASRGSALPAASLPWTFRLLTASVLGSRLGSLCVAFALPWMLAGRATVGLVGAVSAAQLLPYVASPWLGRLPTRYDYRRVLVVTELIQAPATLLLLWLVLHATSWPVILLVLCSGTAEATSGLICDYYALPATVPTALVSRANGVYVAAGQAAVLCAPAVAGALLSVGHPEYLFGFNAISFALTAGTALVLLARPATRVSPRAALPTRQAMRVLRQHRELARLTLCLFAYNLATGAVILLITLRAERVWHWPASRLGVLMVVAGVAAALSAWGSGRRRTPPWTSFRAGLAVCALATAAATLSSNAWAAAVGVVLLTAGEGVVSVAQQTIRQTEIPRDLYGVVNGVMRAAMTGAVPLSRILLAGLGSVASLSEAGIPFAVLSVLAFAGVRRPTSSRRTPAREGSAGRP